VERSDLMKLIELLKKASKGNQDSTIMIVEKFKPLIKKYSYELKYEEANTDLVIALIESISALVNSLPMDADDPLVIYYIQKKLYYKKIDLFRKHVKSKIDTIPVDFIEEITDSTQDNNMLIFIDLLKPLTRRMKDVILMRYAYMMSDSEIALKFNVSRQSISQTRCKALSLIRANLESEVN